MKPNHELMQRLAYLEQSVAQHTGIEGQYPDDQSYAELERLRTENAELWQENSQLKQEAITLREAAQADYQRTANDTKQTERVRDELEALATRALKTAGLTHRSCHAQKRGKKEGF